MKPADSTPLRFTLIAPLLAAAASGWALSTTGFPVAWMIGPLLITAAHNLLMKPRWELPKWVRKLGEFLLGTAIGSMFTADVVAFMISSWLAVVIAIGGAVVAGIVCGRIFLKRSGLDPVTAFYATTVGGAAEMSGLAERSGGDSRLVAMYHSLRIAFVVLLIPLGAALFYAGQAGTAASAIATIPHPLTALKLLAVSFVGAALALRFRLPGGILLGVILTVAFVNLALVELPQLPRELRYLAQLLIGASIGCTFDLEAIRRIQQLLLLKLKIIGLVIGLSLVWATLLWLMTPLDPLTAVLSAAPGGAADMTAAAIALGANAPVVAAIQSLRVIVITLTMPFIIRQAIHEKL